MRKTNFSKYAVRLFMAMGVMAMALGAFPATSAHAAGTIKVTTTEDEYVLNSFCSLREAIVAANTNATVHDCIYPAGSGEDVILLKSGATYTLTRAGADETHGDLDIGIPGSAGSSGNLTIQADGSTNAIIEANDANRVIEVDGGDINLTLKHITLANGTSTDKGAGLYFWGNGVLTVDHSLFYHNDSSATANCGAAIYNNSLATIEITDSTFDTNSCSDLTADGGAIYKAGGGVLNITNSTFSNNSVLDMGGAVRVDMPGGTATITNSTFANNTAGTRGGAIQVLAGTVNISYSTFSGNTANSATTSTGGAVQADTNGVDPTDVTITESILANSITSGAPGKDCDKVAPATVTLQSSLVENNSDCTGSIKSIKDPVLGPLANNGGATQTMALLVGSPAINTGSATCVATDQRGVARPKISNCDLGAYEFTVTFGDVPVDYSLRSYIERLYAAGITGGCTLSPLNYCPTNTVTRAQMAIFLLRAEHGYDYVPPAATGTMFTDVPASHPAAAWIEQLANENITGGCGGGKYCPSNSVNRAQMAIFLLRAEHGSAYVPPAATGTMFTDVPADSPTAPWIERLATEGITGGCNATQYCPSNPVNRAQMAVFLDRTFNLP